MRTATENLYEYTRNWGGDTGLLKAHMGDDPRLDEEEKRKWPKRKCCLEMNEIYTARTRTTNTNWPNGTIMLSGAKWPWMWKLIHLLKLVA